MGSLEKQMKEKKRNNINSTCRNNSIANNTICSKYKCSNGRRWNNKKSRKLK